MKDEKHYGWYLRGHKEGMFEDARVRGFKAGDIVVPFAANGKDKAWAGRLAEILQPIPEKRGDTKA